MQYLGMAVVLALVVGLGFYSGRRVRGANDFVVGGRSASRGIVAGSLIGTLVGGATTIGAAQLAFTYGFSAWWFALGGGIGFLLMGLLFSRSLYETGLTTVPSIIAANYGRRVATVATLLMSVGTFLSIVSQLLSGISLLESIVDIAPIVATAIIVLLMFAYVVFGGIWGAGMEGMAKTLLLCALSIACSLVALGLAGGFTNLAGALPADQYFNLFARGVLKDAGSGLSVVFGILTTQSYFQAFVSARSLKVAREGALIAAVLAPLIGLAGVFVGMYMSIVQPDISPSLALPLFISSYFPPFLSGLMLATLLIALVGTGAGLSLGFSAMVTNDIYRVYINPTASSTHTLLISRAVIVAILVAAAAFMLCNVGSLILDWSFLSMGLRGAVAFAPLCFALFVKRPVKSTYALAATVVGPVCVLVGNALLPSDVDPLFLGILIACVIMGIGFVRRDRTPSKTCS